MPSFARRHFLKLSGAAALSLAFKLPPGDEDPPPTSSPIGLGRITSTVRRRDKPSTSGKVLGWRRADDVVTIYEEQVGDEEPAHNRVWFRLDEGWVHSSFVQPVRDDLNTPILEIPEGGFLAEVTVPFTDAWHEKKLAYRFYYSTTHWVDQAVTDKNGNIWYRVLDDRYQVYYYVLAEHLRRIPDEELTPLSPDVLDKRIEIDLAQQRVMAYENGRAVFTARVATGRKGVETPKGEFRVERKRPSRHTLAPRLRAAQVQVWPQLIAAATVSICPASRGWPISIGRASPFTAPRRWHNDYGRPRSRGCVNLTPENAKWIYRWTLPVVPPGEDYVRDKNGTKVIVF